MSSSPKMGLICIWKDFHRSSKLQIAIFSAKSKVLKLQFNQQSVSIYHKASQFDMFIKISFFQWDVLICASSAILITCIEAKNNCNMVWDIFLFHYCHYWFPISISLSIIQNDPHSIERNRHWILIVCFSFKEHIQTDLLHCHE